MHRLTVTSTASPSLSPEQQQRAAAVCERMYELSDRIAARFVAAFERLDPEAIKDARWGFTEQTGKVNFERGPIKYVLHARKHMPLKLRYLPYLKDVRCAFDIGVGTAQMFMLLRDALGIEVSGLDTSEAEGAFIYKEVRAALGIENDVAMFKVVAGTDVPIPPDSAVLALWPIFDRGWGVEEHAWFMDMCARQGAERVIWRFNMVNAAEPILTFYREKMNAAAPRENDPGFLIVPL
jgi:hypothetical protein